MLVYQRVSSFCLACDYDNYTGQWGPEKSENTPRCGPLGVLGSTFGGCNAHLAKLPKFCEFLRTSSSTACESWSAAVAVVFFRDFMGFFRIKHGEKKWDFNET